VRKVLCGNSLPPQNRLRHRKIDLIGDVGKDVENHTLIRIAGRNSADESLGGVSRRTRRRLVLLTRKKNILGRVVGERRQGKLHLLLAKMNIFNGGET